MLIIALPHAPHADASGYAHVHTDGQTVLRSATGMADALSAYAGEVVAVVPHTRLSWFEVQLPPASHGARLTPVLQGLLEDRLLDDPAHLHMVLPSDATALTRQGGTTQVAVCDKQWLRDALAPLQAAGLTVQRLVPEISPSDTPQLYFCGTPEHVVPLLAHAQGVTTLPPNTAHWTAFTQLTDPALRLYAEPAMVAQVQQQLQQQPELQTAAQRWLAASHSRWDMAQGEWAQGRSQHLQRQLQAAWQSFRHAPAWRPARWGLVVLALVQVIGLNALAWRERQSMQQQLAQLPAVLQNTFPKVTVVVEPLLQMQREVDALKQSTGSLTPSDFEPMLAALASVLPPGQTPTQLHYAAQGLHVQGIAWAVDQLSSAQTTLRARGLSLRQEGNDRWLLQAEAPR